MKEKSARMAIGIPVLICWPPTTTRMVLRMLATGGISLLLVVVAVVVATARLSGATTSGAGGPLVWSVHFDYQNELMRSADDNQSSVMHQLIEVPFDGDRFITEIQVYLDRNDDADDGGNNRTAGIVRMELTACHQIDGEDLFHSTLPLEAVFDDPNGAPFLCLQRLAAVRQPNQTQTVIHRFPDDVGLRFGARRHPDGVAQMVLLTIEYNGNDSLDDQSGFELITVPETVTEAGILAVGLAPDFRFFIPPRLNHWSWRGVCLNGCLDEKLTQPISIVGVVVAAHHPYLARLSVEMADRWQGWRKIFSYPNDDDDSLGERNPIPVTERDKLAVQCTYHTGGANRTIQAGFESENEHCIVWLHYYPRIELDACLSGPSLATIMSVLDLNHVGLTLDSSTGMDLTVQQPDHRWNRSLRLADILEEKDRTEMWNPYKLVRAKYSALRGRQIPQCGWNQRFGITQRRRRRRRKR